MQYLKFDASKKLDLILLGRVAIDFNPAYSETVKEEFGPLKDVHYFEKFVGGSPANIACGVTRHGMKAGFIGKELILLILPDAKTERSWGLLLRKCFPRKNPIS